MASSTARPQALPPRLSPFTFFPLNLNCQKAPRDFTLCLSILLSFRRSEVPGKLYPKSILLFFTILFLEESKENKESKFKKVLLHQF